ncbi:MAG: serine/threonine protein kinase [Clostridia bacterium]|nr:serine/threonine protein kinase [Clostridia bacterium]
MDIGQVLGGKYRILEILGQGGFSVVYLAENLVLNNQWAIKAISRSSPSFSYELKEIEILKNLNHPMLPRITDYLEDEAACYMIMDYIHGTNLLDYLQRNGKVQERTLIVWAKELLEVLSYLHSRMPPIVYRDLKPGNLILDESQKLRLIDFGTARLNREGALEDTLYIGTQGYAAPEQYGYGVSDARTDLYTLGMTLIHLATGLHPSRIEPQQLSSHLAQAGLSKSFIQFIYAITRLKPEERPSSCTEALSLLHEDAGPRFFFRPKAAGNTKTAIKSVIAVASVLPGSGATSLCFGIGCFLTRKGYNVNIVEMNQSGDFAELQAILKQNGHVIKELKSSFEAFKMVFYKGISDLQEVPRKGAEILILDLGMLSHERQAKEMNRADIPIILCPHTLWKLSRIKVQKDRFYSWNPHDEWIYGLFSSQKDEERFIQKETGLHRLVSLPNFSDPFNLSKEEMKQMGKALEQTFELSGLKVKLG